MPFSLSGLGWLPIRKQFEEAAEGLPNIFISFVEGLGLALVASQLLTRPTKPKRLSCWWS
ncbi:hypothetical protein ACVBKF_25060 [Shewanella sp. 0m-11]